MNAIEVHELTKRYRGTETKPAVDQLSFSVPEKGVFGFLGPNGSGKTTTIRCILGLCRPNSGDCKVLGVNSPKELSQVVGQIGSMVEAPRFTPGFSGMLNLELLAAPHRIPRRKILETLELVGLSESAGRSFGHYSLGMKQRLGLAAALLKNPSLLVLDEPANGLDPAGMHEIRQLIRKLADEDRTVFLSSHLLREVQEVCDRVAIISGGHLVATGTVNELMRTIFTPALVVKVGAGLKKAAAVLEQVRFQVDIRSDSLRVITPVTEAGRVSKALADAQIYVTELREEEASLERIFLQLTQEPVDSDDGPS